RITAAVRMTVTRADAHSAQLQHGYRKRGIDIGRAAAADLRPTDLRQQAVNPQVIVETDAHEQARLLEAQRILRLWLIVLGVQPRRNTAACRDPLPADRLGEAAQVGRRRHYL